jgi:putative transposase
MHRAYNYRLSPTVKQTQALSRLLVLQCELFNSALEGRKMTYCWQRRGVSSVSPPTRFDQFKTLTGLSTLRPEFAPYGITVCRGTLQRLDEAFQGFFRRVKKGQQPGYPRFRSAKLFDSLSWPEYHRLEARRVDSPPLPARRRSCEAEHAPTAARCREDTHGPVIRQP